MKGFLPVLIIVATMISGPILAGSPVSPTTAPSKLTSILLVGSKGKSAGDDWQSAYLKLAPRRDFKVGDRLKIRLLGSAKKVLVRFLPTGTPPDKDDGIEGDVRLVPENKILEIALTTEHPDVCQISVHAGHYAWNTDLGQKNGPVDLVSIEYIPASK